MRVPRSSLVLLTSAAAALGASSTAGAVTWSTTERTGVALDAPFVGAVDDPRVAIAADETAVAAWYTTDGEPSVRVATRAPGAPWSTTPVDLTALAPLPELGDFYGVDDVQVATGRSGVVVVSWWEDHEGGMIIRTAVRRGAGPWVVSSPSGPVPADLDDPFVAVSDDGEIAAAWIDESDDDAQLRIRTLAAGTDTWTRPTDVVENRDNEPRLGYLPGGVLVGAYEDRDTDAVVVFEKGAGAPVLNRGLALGGDSESAEPDLAVSRDGRVAAVWQEGEDGDPLRVRSAVRSAAGAWSTSMLERVGTAFSTLPKVGASDAGFVAAWDTRDEGGPAVDAAVLGAGTTWDPTERLVGQLAGPGESDVAVAPDGSATVVWEIFEDDTPMVAGSTRTPGEGWSEPDRVAVTDEGQLSGPQVAAYADGSFTGVWRDIPDTAGPETQLVRSGLLDITGPAIQVAPPATTTVGVPLTLSAAVADRWNAVGSVGWTLPDGTEVDGPDATWTPTVLGDNTLTIRAEDGLRNASVRTIVVRVLPVAVTPPVVEAPPTTTVPPPAVVVPPAPPATPVAPEACAAPYVELIGIRATGAARAPRVRLTGVAGRSLVGRTVDVRRDGRKVGTAKVGADRSVDVSVAAPRAARDRAKARYRLVVGDVRSRALKATRSATISRAVRLAGGRVAVTGRIASVRRATTLTITGTPACGGAKATRTTVRSDARGRFRVTLPAPAVAGSATIYRIAPQGSATVTLPVVVSAG